MGVDVTTKGVELQLGGDLTAVSGVGASAASCVAIARCTPFSYRNLASDFLCRPFGRAVGAALGKELSEEEINAAAYEGEKGYHGTPSGIDNTAATYGGVIHFERRQEGPSIFKQVPIENRHQKIQEHHQ